MNELTAVEKVIEYYIKERNNGCYQVCIHDLIAQLYLAKEIEQQRQKDLEAEQKKRDQVLELDDQIRKARQKTEKVTLSERDKRIADARQELDDNLRKYKDNLDARQKARILYDERIREVDALTKKEKEDAPDPEALKNEIKANMQAIIAKGKEMVKQSYVMSFEKSKNETLKMLDTLSREFGVKIDPEKHGEVPAIDKVIEKIKKIKERLEELGYETSMLMVNTADEVSKQRNIERGQRGGRTVPEEIRKEKWDSVQKSRPEHAKMFGDNYMKFYNSEDLRNATPEVVKSKTKELQDIYKNVGIC